MSVPFTLKQLWDVFAHYNAGVWPAQYLMLLLGIAAAIALLVPARGLLAHCVPPVVFVIPVLWSILGTVAALQLGVTQDLAMPVAAAAALVCALPPRAIPRWKEAI